MARTALELRKLEERRAQLLKAEKSGNGGPAAAIYAELNQIDEKIAEAMGIPVAAVAGMRRK
jgi:hypothetical protein